MADSISVSSIFNFTNVSFFLSPSLSLWFDNYFLCLPSSALDFILFLIYHYSSFPLNIDLCFSDSILSFVTIIDWSQNWVLFTLDHWLLGHFQYLSIIVHSLLLFLLNQVLVYLSGGDIWTIPHCTHSHDTHYTDSFLYYFVIWSTNNFFFNFRSNSIKRMINGFVGKFGKWFFVLILSKWI